jgi:hypothetical protein
MNNKNSINTVIGVLVVIILALGGYYAYQNMPQAEEVITPTPDTTQQTPNAQQPVVAQQPETEVIGKSAGGRDITAYHYGNLAAADTEILLIGGIHGGYSWNTTLVAQEAINWLKANPTSIPANVQVTVIPVLNPDGLSKVVDATKVNFTAGDVTASAAVQAEGRFNGNTVDLNRNFDCDWKSQGKWQSKTVSGGANVFSEPESQAIKAYVEKHNPKGVIVFFSAAGGVYASKCGDTNLPETRVLMNTYATASGYPAHDSFDSYETSGDITNWLAKLNIPAISVLLTNHTDTEWTKNQAGITAVLNHFAK